MMGLRLTAEDDKTERKKNTPVVMITSQKTSLLVLLAFLMSMLAERCQAGRRMSSPGDSAARRRM